MRLSHRRADRTGAATLEAAIVIPVFLLLVLGTLDLGVGVFRHNTLSQAARQGSRQAIVHGKLAPAGWNGGPWGPTTIDVPSTATGMPVLDSVKPTLVGCPPADTRVRVEWPDGGNAVGDRVRVTVTSAYRPVIAWIFGGGTISLSATSTMPIAH